jgi:hypothetical protein
MTTNNTQASVKSNLKLATLKIKILHGILAEAKKDVKRYKGKQKDKSPASYKFDWYFLPLLKAELTKSKILSTIKFIAFQGVTEHKKWLLKQVLQQASSPSRSTSPMVNIQHQEQLSVDAMIYAKLYDRD